MKIELERYGVPSIEEMVEDTNQDSDAASFWAFGDSLETITGAVFVVKGNAETRLARELMLSAGLLTGGKPVVDDATVDHGRAIIGQAKRDYPDEEKLRGHFERLAEVWPTHYRQNDAGFRDFVADIRASLAPESRWRVKLTCDPVLLKDGVAHQLGMAKEHELTFSATSIDAMKLVRLVGTLVLNTRIKRAEEGAK